MDVERIGRNSKSGMTLAEILIVVVIISVLASFILPRFMSQGEHAVVAEAAQMLSAIRHGEEAYFLENNGNYTTSLDVIGIENPNNSSKNFTYSIAADAGTFKATAARKDGDFAGKTVTLDNTGTFGGNHPFGPNPDVASEPDPEPS